MKLKDLAQVEFSTLFFDTVFGLILYFSLDSFLDIKSVPHFAFYLFSTIILVHWWLIFRSADDAFGEEVTDSAADLVFGIVYVILVEYIILYARTFEYHASLGFLLALILVDLGWALLWRYVGKWQTEDHEKIKIMEGELDKTIQVGVSMSIALFCLLFISSFVIPSVFVILFIILYAGYIYLTFKTKIIDLRIF